MSEHKEAQTNRYERIHELFISERTIAMGGKTRSPEGHAVSIGIARGNEQASVTIDGGKEKFFVYKTGMIRRYERGATYLESPHITQDINDRLDCYIDNYSA